MNIHKAAALLFVLMAGTLAYAVSSLSIPTSFNVIAPSSLSASPSSLAFGNIVQGNSGMQTFTLTNTGGVTAASIVCGSSGFDPAITITISGCPASLGPGIVLASVSVTITVPIDFPLGPQTGGTITVSFS